MKSFGMARLGREAEMRYLGDGTPVLNLALAVNYGKKGQDGNRPTQWIEAAMFGERAAKIAEWMVKGSAHCFTLSDVHIETYQKNDGGQGFKLAARVDDVELGPRQDGADAGIEGGSAQSARRTFAVKQHRQGRDLVHIAAILGHKSVSTTKRLVEGDPVRLSDIVAKAV